MFDVHKVTVNMLISFSVKKDPPAWWQTKGRDNLYFRTWKISIKGDYTVSVVILMAHSASQTLDDVPFVEKNEVESGCSLMW